MEYGMKFFEIITGIDQYLKYFVTNYGTLAYLIIFMIIFLETGAVVFLFLPGDSLIFAAGALAAVDHLNILVLLLILTIAAILGDTVNYRIGRKFGTSIVNKKIIKENHIKTTYEFFNKHGGKTIIYARFLPIVRTLAPFIAGISNMDYKYFIKFNVLGGLLWTIIFLFLGYFFGNLSYVKNNYSYVIMAIIVISLLPPLISLLYKKIKTNRGN